MSGPRHLTMQAHVADLPDPRVERTRVHAVLTISTIAVCAVLGGADAWVEVELFGVSKEERPAGTRAICSTCFPNKMQSPCPRLAGGLTA